MSFVKTMALS